MKNMFFMCLELYYSIRHKSNVCWPNRSNGRALTKNWLQTHHLFPSTEIFSKRRKIYAFWRETRVTVIMLWVSSLLSVCSLSSWEFVSFLIMFSQTFIIRTIFDWLLIRSISSLTEKRLLRLTYTILRW